MNSDSNKDTQFAPRVFHAANTKLDHGFTPGPYDVICNRGKEPHNHIGNQRFRQTIKINVQRYVDAPSRLDRSVIVMEIVNIYRNAGGGFVKKDKETGEWVDIGDTQAREKVGHALRVHINSKASKDKKTLRINRPATTDHATSPSTKPSSLQSCCLPQVPLDVSPTKMCKASASLSLWDMLALDRSIDGEVKDEDQFNPIPIDWDDIDEDPDNSHCDDIVMLSTTFNL